MKLLAEGDTPLIPSQRIGPERKVAGLYFKLESCNPSGSYKDRFIAAEMKLMLERGVKTCIATSSGNTGSALAAYSARFGIRCVIFVNEGAPSGKLQQMQAHGAHVVRIPDFVTDPAVTDHVFSTLRRFSAENGAPLIVSAFRYCPGGMQGVESISQELIAQLNGADIEGVFVPVGGGGLYAAMVQGFQNAIGTAPKVHAVQPSGCSTVAASFRRGDADVRPVVSRTRISGLSVPADIDGSLALRLLRECKGSAFEVDDEEVYAAQRLLLTQEGICCEPAGAAALAGWIKAAEIGVITRDRIYVCLVTGHGFKDPDSLGMAAMSHPSTIIAAGQIEKQLPALLEPS